MNRIVETLTTLSLAAIAFLGVSVVSIVLLGSKNVGSQVSAHHGDTEDPPWVNADGTMNWDLMPDRMPLADGNGGTYGYVAIDKNPLDDPEPGDAGYDEWKVAEQTVYVSETSNEIAGTIDFDAPDGSRAFTPVTENEEPPPVPR